MILIFWFYIGIIVKRILSRWFTKHQIDYGTSIILLIPRYSLPNMSSTSNTNELSNLHVLENQLHSSSNLNRGNTSTNTYHSVSQEQPTINDNVDHRHSGNNEHSEGVINRTSPSLQELEVEIIII